LVTETKGEQEKRQCFCDLNKSGSESFCFIKVSGVCDGQKKRPVMARKRPAIPKRAKMVNLFSIKSKLL
jgi:hypothetical protein